MLLEVKNLCINHGTHALVHDLSFTVERGRTFGIVGESGCGKSLSALAIMGLLDNTPLHISSGAVYFDKRNLLTLDAAQRRALMGSRIAMIFQEPMTSLNPVYRVGDQIAEMILQHRKIGKKAAQLRACELLRQVRMPDPQRRLRAYPHQLSGGQCQRVMIAMALACEPQLLIADEPTTALDVTVQVQILNLLAELQAENDMAVILISHDLGVIAENCDFVAVMYRGRIVESAPGLSLFAGARHPYTHGLMASIPNPRQRLELLDAIPGRVPAAAEFIPGCAFQPRCKRAQALCAEGLPPLRHEHGHSFLCQFPHQGQP